MATLPISDRDPRRWRGAPRRVLGSPIRHGAAVGRDRRRRGADRVELSLRPHGPRRRAPAFASSRCRLELFDWLLAKNLAAGREADHHYYLLRHGGEAVSCLLTVDTKDALGIFAVATPPALRRQGLSGALLQAVCEDDRGRRPIGLQVIEGSPARSLYEKLGFGFVTVCLVDMHRVTTESFGRV
jgi:GNAT superfamily N-acetyltransferase